MIRLLKSAAGLLALALVWAAGAAAWEVQLTVEEQHAVGGLRRVTGGVPLLEGQAKDLKELRLVTKDAQGKATAVPAQFRELARWWRSDNSLRWVLLDFEASLGLSERKTYYLTNEGEANPAPKQPATVEETDEAVTVSTGPAKFVISKKKFGFLQSAAVNGEELLEGSADLGTVLEDTFGEKYYSAEGTREVKVV